MIHEFSLSLMTSHIDLFFLAQIVTLLICAISIGFERKLRDKPFGMRTSILIMLGSMLFVKYGNMMLESYLEANSAGDPSRVLGQVITGIGFLGAGTIMRQEGIVVGLTTAATIWVEAAIGAIISFGYLIDAALYTVIVIMTLHGLSWIERKFLRRRRRKSPDLKIPGSKH